MDISVFNSFLKSQRDGFASFLKGCTCLDSSDMRLALQEHNAKMFDTLIASRARSSDKDNASLKSPFNRSSSLAGTPTDTPKKPGTPSSSRPSSAPERAVRSRAMTLGGVSRLFTYTGHAIPTGNSDLADDDDSSAGSPVDPDDSYTTSKKCSSKKKADKKKTAVEKPVSASGSAKKKERSLLVRGKGKSSRGEETFGPDDDEYEKKKSPFQKRVSRAASDRMDVDSTGIWKEIENVGKGGDDQEEQTRSKRQKTGRKGFTVPSLEEEDVEFDF